MLILPTLYIILENRSQAQRGGRAKIIFSIQEKSVVVQVYFYGSPVEASLNTKQRNSQIVY